MKKTLLFFTLVLFILPYSITFADTTEIDEIQIFEKWAQNHGINLVGVSKNSHDLYYTGYNTTTDSVNWKEIPNVLIAADALYQIPKNVLQVMDGKTIYFSTEKGRSYTVLDSFPDYNVLVGLNRGIILEQNINPHTVIHEIGHIIDYHGIKGIYNDEQNIFKNSLDDRNEIFNVPPEDQSYPNSVKSGYISTYSSVNDAENFAENFAYYVIHPNEFRERISNDVLLIEEYEFLKEHIFDNLEY